MPKIFFIDNWIRNSIDHNFELEWDSFENIFFNQINNSYKYEKINFYRTTDKKEIDFILDLIPYELKLSLGNIIFSTKIKFNKCQGNKFALAFFMW
jgi:predicted AAA+ superfamily ATPase